MRARHPKSLEKTVKRPKRSSRPRRTLLANEWPDVSGDRAEILTRLEKSEFAKGNTANGRKPSYKPEYAEYAKAMCERGATTDELAVAFGVSVDVISLWQRVQPDFFEACKLTPACIERVKRSIFESAVGKIVGQEKTVVSGSQIQTTKSRADMPANFGAAKFFTSQKEFQVEGELRTLLRELQGTRVRPKRLLPGEILDSEEEIKTQKRHSGSEHAEKTKFNK